VGSATYQTAATTAKSNHLVSEEYEFSGELLLVFFASETRIHGLGIKSEVGAKWLELQITPTEVGLSCCLISLVCNV